MLNISGFRLSKIVIIESLEPNEFKTGAHIRDEIRALENESPLGIEIELHLISHADEFADLIRLLAADAVKTGRSPLLHVECHGNRTDSLVFENSSVLSWQDLSCLLTDLNVATRFNLVALFAACYGAHFLLNIDNVGSAPFYGLIAPIDDIWPDELLGGFKIYYSTLFATRNARLAAEAIQRMKLQNGQWHAHHSENWFWSIAVRYIETHCTNIEVKKNALRMLQKFRSNGLNPKIGDIKRNLVKANRELVSKFFDKYFMVDRIPENIHRFSSIRTRIDQRVLQLKKTGRYRI